MIARFAEPGPAAVDPLAAFAPVTLAAANARAAMLDRRTRKYVVADAVLRELLVELRPDFDALEIDGRRRFAYDTVYFDDTKLTSYYDHHQGRRQRFKVRTRVYDTGDCYLEVKVKGPRGRTLKLRRPHPAADARVLGPDARAFVDRVHRDHYRRPAPARDTRPSLRLFYERSCLVRRDGDERLTVDCRIAFHRDAADPGRFDRVAVPGDRYIIETKSPDGRGVADRALRRLGQRPVRRCSKYCLGLALTRGLARRNRFRPALRRLIGEPSAITAT